MKWNEVAKVVENDFGVQVEREEKIFVCPDCGDVIYECDFNKDSVLALGYCPICGAALTEECECENFYEDEEEEYETIEDIWPDYPQKEDFFFNEEEY